MVDGLEGGAEIGAASRRQARIDPIGHFLAARTSRPHERGELLLCSAREADDRCVVRIRQRVDHPLRCLLCEPHPVSSHRAGRVHNDQDVLGPRGGASEPVAEPRIIRIAAILHARPLHVRASSRGIVLIANSVLIRLRSCHALERVADDVAKACIHARQLPIVVRQRERLLEGERRRLSPRGLLRAAAARASRVVRARRAR